jgi:hypothetical protein
MRQILATRKSMEEAVAYKLQFLMKSPPVVYPKSRYSGSEL